MNSLIKNIQTFSKRFDLFCEGSKIVIGVSGGPDSVCLADVLNKLKNKYGWKLLIAHINYNLRGKNSKADERFVEKMANDLGLEFVLLEKNGFNFSDVGLENNLRNIRYKFFEKVRRENNFDFIAVAHNRNDQAETFLMRVLRGSGLQGLRSIRPKNEKIIRPLLKTSRKEILNYLKENNLKYRIDESNKDLKFFRNKIRGHLLPLLEKKYNPVIQKTLAEASENIADDYDFIFQEAEKMVKDVYLKQSDNKIEISIGKITKIHPALQRQILRRTLLKVRKNLADIQNAHIEEILKILKSSKGKNQIKEFADLKIVRKGDSLIIECLAFD